jgi:hypothetical protein
MFILISYSLSLMTPPPVTVREVTSPPPSAWVCSAPRELVQGSGTVRECTKGGSK